MSAEPAATGDGDEARLSELLRQLQPPPRLPLTGPFTAGLGALIGTWCDLDPGGPLGSPRVRSVLSALGRRLSITVSPQGFTVTGIIRTRTVPWSDVEEVRLDPRYALLRDRAVAGTASQLLTRGRLPIPGLDWLLRTVLGLLERLLPASWRTTMTEEGGQALATIVRRRGRDVQIEGPLAFVAFLSEGLTAAVVDEAGRRGVLAGA